MPVILMRKAALTAKIESTEGTEAVPSASTDGVLVENLRVTPNPNVIDTNEVTPSLDAFDPIVGGMFMEIAFDVYMKGSGTAGTAPEWNDLLKACGFSETITGTAVPAAAEALAAGGSTITAVLGTSAAATLQLYRGMPINFTGNQVGTSFIYDYSAAKLAKLTDTFAGALVATTNYQIPVNIVYGPASSSISSLTMYVYNDGLLYKFTGCRGNVSFAFESGGPAKMSFTFRGMFLSKTDVALPTVTYDSTRPPIWKGGAFTINSVAAAGQSLSLDVGNQLAQPDNPAAAEGFDPAVITARQMRGSINPNETLIATRDIMADFRAQTKRPIHGRLGSTAGNRIGITMPSGLYLGQTPGDRNGIRTVDVPFAATGQDAGAFITQW